jgi:hypothetical protein
MSNKSLNLAIVVFGICSNLYGLHGVKFGLPMPEPVFGGHYQVHYT